MQILLWFLGPIGRYVTILALLGGAWAYGRQHYINIGYKKALAAIEAQDIRAKGKSDETHKTVSDCFDAGGAWDIDNGVCIQSNSGKH